MSSVRISTLDDRVRRLPAVGARGRVGDAHDDGAGLTMRCEAPVRACRAGEIFHPPRFEVVEGDLRVVLPDELGDARCFAGGDERRGESAQSVEKIRACRSERRGHRWEGSAGEAAPSATVALRCTP
jgi:hypothetical protein